MCLLLQTFHRFLESDKNEDLGRHISVKSSLRQRKHCLRGSAVLLDAMFTFLKRSFFTYALLIKDIFRLHKFRHTRVY